jgi:hypothetical protein
MNQKLTQDDFVLMLSPSRYKNELKELRMRITQIYEDSSWLYDAKTKDERKRLVDELKADLDSVLANIRALIEGAE